jgi:hypothetical protein
VDNPTTKRPLHDQIAFEVGYPMIRDLALVTYQFALDRERNVAVEWDECVDYLRVAVVMAQALAQADILPDDEAARVLVWNLSQLPESFRPDWTLYRTG